MDEMTEHLDNIREIVCVEGSGIYRKLSVPIIYLRCKDSSLIKSMWFCLFDYLRKNNLRNKVIGCEIFIFPPPPNKE